MRRLCAVSELTATCTAASFTAAHVLASAQVDASAAGSVDDGILDEQRGAADCGCQWCSHSQRTARMAPCAASQKPLALRSPLLLQEKTDL